MSVPINIKEYPQLVNSRRFWDYRVPQTGQSKELFIGLELEVQNTSSRQRKRFLTKLVNKRLNQFYCLQYDCTLDTQGSLELATVPFKPTYTVINRIIKLPTVLKLFKKHSFFTDEDCGLHIHVNRSHLNLRAELLILELVFIVMPDIFRKLSRREKFSWCSFYGYSWLNSNCISTELYSAVSKTERTLEFRFFGGSIELNEVLFSISTIISIVKWSKQSHVPTDKSNYLKMDFLRFIKTQNPRLFKVITDILRR